MGNDFILIVLDRLSLLRDSLGRDLQPYGAAAVVEIGMKASVFVGLGIGIPVESPSIVLHLW